MNYSILETIEQHEWDCIIGSILKKFSSLYSSDALISHDDLKQEAWIALLEATKTYDPSRSKFTTYAYFCIKYHLCKVISRKLKNKPTQVSEDPTIILEGESYEDETAENNDIKEMLTRVTENEPYADLYYEHYVKGRSLRDLGKEYGVSRMTIKSRINKLNERLLRRLNNDNS